MDEHDYKKMLRFMRKSLKSFKKEVVQITKPFIDNIDFLIVNFPYFEDIKMVSEYFMTQNEDFNNVFYAKFHSFSHILFYDPLIKSSQVYDEVSINKLELWTSVLGRSGREKLKRLWVRKHPQVSSNNTTTSNSISNTFNKDDDIYKLNDKDLVLESFFKILNYHFKKIKYMVLDHLDMKQVLLNLHKSDSFVSKLIELREVSLFQGIETPTLYFIDSGKYYLLDQYIDHNNTSTIDFDRLVYLFLTLPKFSDYKSIYNVLVKKAPQIQVYEDFIFRRGIFVQDGKFICSDTKYILYISLLSKNILDIEILRFISEMWVNNPENAFLSGNIYKILQKNEINLEEIIREEYKKGYSETMSSRPRTSTLYSYCLKILKRNRLDKIKYNEEDKINKYIDECYDETFMRFISKLVIDELPVLNIFTKN
ncbi:uncharacterized protein VNE69_03130 [Vairimorpha necatrix]|uniref:Uncharacterized protein n=1 Tax=Vairimorpha necatrix TaxID=6039 RepID=A0AAX4JAI9_9MICR